jgi:hypothetical protein
MPLICLDTNAFNGITWRGDAAWIASLHRRLRQPSCTQILVVGALLDELAPMLLDPRARNPDDDANRMLQFLLSGVRVRGLFQPRERMVVEIHAVQSGAIRPMWACLHSESATREMLSVNMRDPEKLKESAAFGRESAEAIDEERNTRLQVQKELPKEFDLNDVHLDVLSDWDVRRQVRNLGFDAPDDDTPWPASRDIRSLWHLWGVVWAYRYLHFAEVERVEKSNDAADFLIYRDAANADVIVTDDRKLRKCIELAPEPKARVMRLREWADSV